jgi:hypothetical protein
MTDQRFPTKEAAEHFITQQGYEYDAFGGGVNIYSSSDGKCCASRLKEGWRIHQWKRRGD